MKGLLIYDQINYDRNIWFIRNLKKNFEDLRIGLDVTVYNGNFGLINVKEYDFFIVRTINPELSLRLSESGKRIFNNYNTSLIANDKYKTYLLCKELNIPVMQTETSFEKLNAYPCVIKSIDGHGGKEVFWAQNDTELIESLNALKGKSVIFQKPTDTLGIDVRVYVLGGKIVKCVKRESKSGFKSNFSLGGNAYPFEITKDMLVTVDKIVKNLNPDFIGIDFLFNNGKWVLNEIEDVVGSRMLYSVYNYDIVKDYVNYVVNNL